MSIFPTMYISGRNLCYPQISDAIRTQSLCRINSFLQ